jgi:hypothetical protein
MRSSVRLVLVPVRLVLVLFLAFGAVALSANPIVVSPPANDWANPPLAIVAENVNLTVGRDLTMVSGQYMFQYVEKDDVGHLARIFIHYPLYVEKGLRDWQEVATASDIKLQVGPQTFLPTSGGLISADYLSDFPIPEDAAVAFLTFEIPRDVAKWRFEVTITHVQPNFHYRGALLAAYTPWLPKIIKTQKVYNFTDQDFSVAIKALEGISIKRYTANAQVVPETAGAVVVAPEHRKTIAVEILPAKPVEPGKAGGPPAKP